MIVLAIVQAIISTGIISQGSWSLGIAHNYCIYVVWWVIASLDRGNITPSGELPLDPPRVGGKG